MKTLLKLLLVLLSTNVYADIYKWTDANGQTHYSTSMPSNAHGKEIKVSTETPTQDTPISSKQPTEQTPEMLIQEAAEKLKAQNLKVEQENAKIEAENKKIAAINCERAKAQLSQLQLRPRMKMNTDNAQIQLTQEQLETQIQATQDAIKQYCLQ